MISDLGWVGVDRVTRLEAGRAAEGYCNVPLSLGVFDTHFPRLPVLPGMLILDALVELGARCLEPGTPSAWTPTEVAGMRFREMVRPGDQLLLGVETIETLAGWAALSASAQVGDRVVASIRRLEMRRSAEPSQAAARKRPSSRRSGVSQD